MEPCEPRTPDGWTVTALPAFADNYVWTLLSPDGQRAITVDPGDAQPVLTLCQKAGAVLTDIFITHHHADHVSGIPALRAAWPGVRVWGPANERIAGVEHRVSEGMTLTVEGLDDCIRVLDIPGHTAGHIAYFFDRSNWLFCGDTLFAAGCGRLFEGTAEQMFASLQKIGSLPGQTRVFCTHEYTQSNLRFARAAEPANTDIAQRAALVDDLRARGLCTLPSLLSVEWLTNPFLRASNASEFAVLRQQKDRF